MPKLTLPPLSLYVHLPWCVRKCPYCDFNSHALASELPEQAYVDALLLDLSRELAQVKGRKLYSLFLGGGTPSLFSPASLERLLQGIRALIPWQEEIEITLEANPGTVESGKLREFRALGINRLSLGIQAFQDAKLKALGRIHTAREAIAAIETAKSAGFDNLNLDLMFGLPGQTLGDALSDIATAIRYGPTHISFYQLTIEPNTVFARYPPSLPSENTVWRVEQLCREKLEMAGFQRYEISAYAKEGFKCRHNLNYWRFGDYLGIGAGAHGKLTYPEKGKIYRSWKIRHPWHYMHKAKTCARLGEQIQVEDKDKPLEFLMNTLRLKEGFSPAQFERRTGLSFAQIEPTINELLQVGWLSLRLGRIACTPLGWNFLDTLLESFVFSDLNLRNNARFSA